MQRIIAIALCALLFAAQAAAQQVGPNGGLLSGKEGHQAELVLPHRVVLEGCRRNLISRCKFC